LSVTADSPSLRRFGLVMAGLVAGIFGLLLPWLLGHPWPWWPWAVAAGFVVPALAAPRLLGPVHRLWMRFGDLAGWVNTHVTLGLVFYLLMTPLGLAMRLFGYDPMRLRRRAGEESYRVPRESPPRPEDMERPF
jgi:hypothetical protein